MIRVIVDPNSKCLWQTFRVRVNHDPIYNFIPEPINPKCLPQKKIRLSRRMLMIWTFQADWQSLQYLSSPKSWLDSSIPRSVVYHKARLTSQCRELLFQGVPNCLKMWVMFMKTWLQCQPKNLFCTKNALFWNVVIIIIYKTHTWESVTLIHDDDVTCHNMDDRNIYKW